VKLILDTLREIYHPEQGKLIYPVGVKMTESLKLANKIRFLYQMFGNKAVPAYWIHLLLIVDDSGLKGITTNQVARLIMMENSTASRVIKLMSKYINPVTNKIEGYDLLVQSRDIVHRQRQRIFLSKKGEKLFAEFDLQHQKIQR
jgi:hypothetical protein